MGENRILWEGTAFALTGYGLAIALGALLSVCLLFVCMHRRGADREASIHLALVSAVGALVGAHLVYCAAMAPSLVSDYGGLSLIVAFYRGGYTLYGAVFGVLFSVWLSCRVRGEDFLRSLDALVPSAALMLCVGRAAEVWTDQGLGPMVESALWQRFPFAVCTYQDVDWSEWYLAVFIFEALTAALFLVRSFAWQKKARKSGETAIRFLTYLSCTQIFFEQMRQDDCIRFGFVRFSQLAALCVLLILLFMRLRSVERKKAVLAFVRFALCALIVVWIEFAFEKPQFYPHLIVTSLAAFVLFLPVWDRTWNAWRILRTVLLACGLVLLFFTVREEYAFEIQVLYGAMAVALAGLGATVLENN